ncbi:MAG: hypothetical protein R2882_05620 [Gemmatimonadales bacterium]
MATTVTITGSPILPPTPERREAARARFRLGPADRVVLVTGGSQGALAINERVAEWIDAGLPPGLVVICHRLTSHERLARYGDPPNAPRDGVPRPDGGRLRGGGPGGEPGGMTTIAEICAWGLHSDSAPTAVANHQAKNAAALEAAGRPSPAQATLTGRRLGEAIGELLGTWPDWPNRRRAASGAARAVAEICTRLEGLVGA